MTKMVEALISSTQMKKLLALCISFVLIAFRGVAQQGPEAPRDYDWLNSTPRADCVGIPAVEREKFGCILDRPPATELSDAVLDWPWLTAVRPVDCAALPRSEREKFRSCGASTRSDDHGLERDAHLLLEGLRQTRNLFQARFERVKRRRALLAGRAAPLATIAELEDLEAAKAQLERLEAQRSRAELVEAFAAAMETMALPKVRLSGPPSLSFALIRGRADAFASAAPDAPSLARLDRGERVLKVGNEVVNARRLIFAPSTNFVYVGASLVIEEKVQTPD